MEMDLVVLWPLELVAIVAVGLFISLVLMVWQW